MKMRDTVALTLVAMTGYAMWHSWTATWIMLIIDLIGFIIAWNTTPVTYEQCVEKHEYNDNNTNKITSETDYEHSIMTGNGYWS